MFRRLPVRLGRFSPALRCRARTFETQGEIAKPRPVWKPQSHVLGTRRALRSTIGLAPAGPWFSNWTRYSYVLKFQTEALPDRRAACARVRPVGHSVSGV